MSVVGLIRLIAFGVVIAFALICLGIGANFISIAAGSFIANGVGGLAVAIGVITLLLIPAVLIIDHLRKGAIITAVWVELIWVGILDILWIAVAGHATAQLFGLTLNCDAGFGFFSDEAISQCRQYQALQAFSWLNWLILFFWFWFLLISALVGVARKNKGVWSGPASDIFNHTGKTVSASTPVGYPAQQPYGAGAYQQPQMTGQGAYPPAPGTPGAYQTGYAPPTGQPYGAAQV